jgi:alanine racemase
VPQGQSVGYGAAWIAKRASRVAIAALGYADGLARAGSGVDRKAGGSAIVAGKRCPVIGYISMDLACIDATELPDNAVRRGGSATFIGDGIPIDDIAAAAGTIGYEVLVRLGSRCHLAYRGG